MNIWINVSHAICICGISIRNILTFFNHDKLILYAQTYCVGNVGFINP